MTGSDLTSDAAGAPHPDGVAGTGRGGPTRRQLLLGGAVAGLGAVAAIGVDTLTRGDGHAAPAGSAGSAGSGGATGAADRVGSTDQGGSTDQAGSTDHAPETLDGGRTVPFYGVHQAGIETPPQAHTTLVALDLLPDVDRDGLRRLLRLLTDDAARLTQGLPALADSEPELAHVPARLTVTFGLGPGLVRRAAAGPAPAGAGAGRSAPEGVPVTEGAPVTERPSVPAWLRPLPAFSVDRLEEAWSGGDLLLQIGADDPLTVAHAQRMLLKDTRSFARVRWTQSGFRRAHGSQPPGTTMRNLFGQVDGTANPAPGTDDFDELVWVAQGWLAGGTSMVVRRISMDLEGWDRLDRGGREQSVGRFLSNGAPLTGTEEHDEPDFTATTAIGFPVIPEFSHVRRSRSDDPSQRIFRRAYNIDDAPGPDEISRSGLLFVSFQADVDAQFVPIQQRLDDLDLLNEWTTPVGSAVFAVPPGCAEGGYVGETLLEPTT